MSRFAFIAALLSVLAVLPLGAQDRVAELNPDRADSVLEEVKLNVSAVAWNEASAAASPDEARAIFHTQWTVAGGTRATPERVLDAQRRLSSRVTQAAEPREVGNERWSRHLRWNNARPAGWHWTGLEWAPRFERHWSRVRRNVNRWVDNHFAGAPVRQCQGTPMGWGGPGLDDHILEARNARRVERGLAPFRILECGDVRNNYFGIPPRDAEEPTLASL